VTAVNELISKLPDSDVVIIGTNTRFSAKLIATALTHEIGIGGRKTKLISRDAQDVHNMILRRNYAINGEVTQEIQDKFHNIHIVPYFENETYLSELTHYSVEEGYDVFIHDVGFADYTHEHIFNNIHQYSLMDKTLSIIIFSNVHIHQQDSLFNPGRVRAVAVETPPKEYRPTEYRDLSISFIGSHEELRLYYYPESCLINKYSDEQY
jgi:hypothetical protein